MGRGKKIVILITLGLLAILTLYPAQMLNAAQNAITLWLGQVFPSLFPFMAATGILMRAGAAAAMGRKLQKWMPPLFGVNGVCAFPFLMGLLSGYPMGAKMTASLYQQGAISLSDAQKTLRFCNNPGPLFVIGTTGAALLKNPAWGYYIMLCICLSSLATGLLFRFTGDKHAPTVRPQALATPQNDVSLGAILGGAVIDAAETMLQIGGFIILFAAIIEALSITGIFHIFANMGATFLPLSQQTLSGLLAGILEMTNGAALLSATTDHTQMKLCCIAAILAFGGLSILAQTLAILSPVPIQNKDYIFSKIINGVFAGSFAYFLYPLLERQQKTAPVFSTLTGAVPNHHYFALLSLFFFYITILWVILRHIKRQ